MNTTLMHFVGGLLSINFHFTVTSAKRSSKENEAAGGVPNSQHLTGEAIDIKPYGSTTYDMLVLYIQNYSLYSHVFDQLILYPTFIHVSYDATWSYHHIDTRKQGYTDDIHYQNESLPKCLRHPHIHCEEPYRT